MGGCQSTDANGPAKNRPNHAPNHEHVRANGGTATKKHKKKKKNDNIQSLVRVGSKVLKDAPGQSRLEVHRASTYDHVHTVVASGLTDKTGIVGLQNLGNTCFLNSSLQCLSNTIPLTDYFLGYDYRNEINHSNVLGTRGALANAYTALMKQVWLKSPSRLDPSAFYRQVVNFAPQFGGGHQHDTQELLAYLLDGIHEDLNRVKDRPYIEDKDCDGSNDEGDAVVCWQNYLLRNRSIVVDLFQGQLRSTLKCCVCGYQKIKFEPFMYLSLPISSDCITLDDCLDLYSKEEFLTGDNQWYCSCCRKHVNATKRLDLWMLPPILIIHLKRFDGYGNKIESPLYYPTTNWDLSRAVKSKSGLYPQFDLYAVANHSGTLNGGHYTAFCKNRFDQQWYELNDSSTRRVSTTNLEGNPKAYCLFYNRVERTGDRKRSDPKVMRQSVDRPELWPHLQIQSDFRDFRRSTVATMPLPTNKADGGSGGGGGGMPIIEEYSS